MIIRVVRVTFAPAHVPAFLALFRASWARIRQQPGCRHLELWQDADHPATYCTYLSCTHKSDSVKTGVSRSSLSNSKSHFSDLIAFGICYVLKPKIVLSINWLQTCVYTIDCTYSRLESAAALDAYRRSALFGEVWPRYQAAVRGPASCLFIADLC